MKEYRSIFISDLHLASRNSQAEKFNDFLNNAKSEYLYLVGDIFDLWRIKKKQHYWDQNHNNAVRRIFSCAKRGTKVFLITGNHEDYLRVIVNDFGRFFNLGNISVCNESVHSTLDGRRLLVLHGDQYDFIVRNKKLLTWFSDWGYDFIIVVGSIIKHIRRKLGLSYWSLALFMKRKVKNFITFVNHFEELITKDSIERSFDGVICGHIHYAEIKEKYMNCGHWTDESECTALVENLDGSMEIVKI